MSKGIFDNKASSKASPPAGGGGLEGAVLCFGEILLRMSPVLNREWIHNASMPVYIGGAELNVASALAKWNVPVKYCTAMPDNYLSHDALEELRSKKIDTSAVYLSGTQDWRILFATGS